MKENSTRLYIASTAEFADKELYERAYQRMTTERKQKTDRFRLDRDRKLSVGAFLLLDYGLEKRGIEDWKRGLWYNERRCEAQGAATAARAELSFRMRE